uniref:Uncharacterized protein n=1 Tax=Physcomitrium patens TaxID=3218 RepID=A0A2K1JQD4_PHYPA|nr:hypothetical protein PHYPA_016132 [Physcomitrium patens]
MPKASIFRSIRAAVAFGTKKLNCSKLLTTTKGFAPTLLEIRTLRNTSQRKGGRRCFLLTREQLKHLELCCRSHYTSRFCRTSFLHLDEGEKK